MPTRLFNSIYLLWAVLAVPAAVYLYAYGTDAISYGEFIHVSGEWAVRLLIVTMAATPLRLMFARARWPLWLVQRRRAFGVACFCYAGLHLLVYLLRKADLDLIIEEGLEPDLCTGWAAMALFSLLALTSNDYSMRLLRRAWKNLHRLVYPAAALTLLHWVLAAFDMTPGLIYAGILAALEALRLAIQARRARVA